MKRNLLFAATLAVISLVLSSCWPAQTYDKNGLSFDYPGGWTVTDDEFSNGQGYLSLSGQGQEPKATITFGWMELDTPIGADMMLANILKEMQAGDGLTDVVPEAAKDVEYGPYAARAVNYTATQNGVAVAGAVWVFRAEGRVVNVAVREGADKANLKEFKKIKDSFRLSTL